MPHIPRRSPFFIVYDWAFCLFGLFYLPFFLRRLAQAAHPWRLLCDRLGFPAGPVRPPAGRRLIWIHAVSVGEVMAVRPLLKEMAAQCPELSVLLTTVTPTGEQVARPLEGDRLSVRYAPFDISFMVRRFLKLFRPECLLLVETELWPNLLLEAGRAGVRIGIANARLSQRSAERYRRFRFLLGPAFRELDFVLAQTETDRDRYELLGIGRDRIRVFGNMKFDAHAGAEDAPNAGDLRRQWGVAQGDLVAMGGSTHAGEEEILLRVFGRLRPQFPDLRLILAPRHVERAAGVTRLAARHGWKVRTWGRSRPVEGFDVLVIDRMGVLKNLYALADAVFMGGSLVRRGGQNPIEPACASRAILHGPHVFNFQRVYEILHRQGGALAIDREPRLEEALRRLLMNPEERIRMGEAACDAVRRSRGATASHVRFIVEALSPGSQERKEHHVPFGTQLLSQARAG